MSRLHLRFALLVALGLSISGCKNLNSYAYRIDVPQGNLVTEEMAQQLRIGMSREQVQFLLGQALVRSDFHMNRWDYVYYFNPRRGDIQIRKITIFFDKNARVEKIEKDDLPTESEADRIILGTQADFKKNTKE